jgi:hypothetical protein
VIRGVGVAAALLCASVLEAQEGSLFVGGSRARYADSLDGTAAFAAGRLRAGHGLKAADLDAAFSAFTSGGWALQLTGQTTVLWRAGRSRGPYVGFAGGAALNAYQGGTPSGSFAAGLLVAVAAGSSYLSLGAAGGTVRRVDSTWSPLRSISARWQWAPAGVLSVDAGVTYTGSDTNRLADASLGFRTRAGAVRAAAVAGTRIGDLADGPWGSLELVWQTTPVVSIEASAGRFPQDLAGFSHGLYAQAGVRLATRGAGGPALPPLTVTPLDGGRVRVALRYRRPAATLAITGDWNGWTEVPLRHERGWWIVELVLPRGVHHFALVADGNWTLPDGVRGIADEFGGQVAQLIVQ